MCLIQFLILQKLISYLFPSEFNKFETIKTIVLSQFWSVINDFSSMIINYIIVNWIVILISSICLILIYFTYRRHGGVQVSVILFFTILFTGTILFHYFIPNDSIVEPVNQTVLIMNNLNSQKNVDCFENISFNKSTTCQLYLYDQNFHFADILSLLITIIGGFSLFIYSYIFIKRKANFFRLMSIDDRNPITFYFAIYFLSLILLPFCVFLLYYYWIGFINGGNPYEVTFIRVSLIVWFLITFFYIWLIRSTQTYHQIRDFIITLNTDPIMRHYLWLLNFMSIVIFVTAILGINFGYKGHFNILSIVTLELILLTIYVVCSAIANLPRSRVRINLINPDFYTRISLNDVIILQELSDGSLSVLREDNTVITIMKNSISSIESLSPL